MHQCNKKTNIWTRLLALTVALCIFTGFGTVLAEAPKPVEGVEDEDVIAYAIFGKEVVTSGMKVWMGKSPEAEATEMRGKSAWVLDTSKGQNQATINVDIDDNKFYNLSDGSNFLVEIEYYDDNEFGTLAIEYAEYKHINPSKDPTAWGNLSKDKLTSVKIPDNFLQWQNRKAWVKHTWLMENAAMNNCVDGADFRFGIYATGMGLSDGTRHLIHSVKVKKTGTKSVLGIEVKKYGDKFATNFFEDEKVKLDVGFTTTKNPYQTSGGSGYPVEVTYTLEREADGAVIDSIVKNVNIIGGGEVIDTVEFKNPPFGVYNFIIEARNDEKGIYSTGRQGVSFNRSRGIGNYNPRMGLNLGLTAFGKKTVDGTVRLVSKAGFSSVRFCQDNMMALTSGGFKENGLMLNMSEVSRIAGLVDMTRGFAERGITTLTFTNNRGSRGGLQLEQYPESVTDAIPVTDEGRERVYQIMAEHLRSMITDKNEPYYYEFGNEPDLAYPRDTIKNATDIANLFKYCVPKLKAEFPNLKITGPTIAHYGFYPEFICTFLDIAGDCIDVFDCHPYNFNSTKMVASNTNDYVLDGKEAQVSLQRTRDILDSYGMKDMPIWVTEYSNANHGRLETTDQMQAEKDIIRTLQQHEKDVVERMYLFQLNASRLDWSNGELTYGATDYEGDGKQKLTAHAALNYLMYDAKFEARTDIVPNETMAYRFKREDKGTDLMVLMTDKDREIITMDLGVNEVTKYDIFGNEEKLVSDDGTYTVAISSGATYIEGNFKKHIFTNKVTVGPERVLFAPSETISVPVYNRTKSELKISASAHEKTDTTVEVVPFEDGVAYVNITPGDVPTFAAEPVRIVVEGEKGIYFDDEVTISYSMDLATLAAGTERQADGSWKMYVEIANPTDAQVAGTFTITGPEKWITEPERLVIDSKQTHRMLFDIPEGTDLSRVTTVGFEFVVNSKGDGVFVSVPLSFAYAVKATGENAVKIDGDFSDWEDAGWLDMTSQDQWVVVPGYNNVYRGYDDLHGRIAYKWDDENLYVAVDTYDNVILNEADKTKIWSQDSVQLGVRYDPGNICEAKSFEEINLGLQNGVSAIYRTTTYSASRTASGDFENYDFVCKKIDEHTLHYELRISWDDVTPAERKIENRRPKTGDIVRIGAQINDDDGDGRKGFMVQGQNAVDGKDAYKATPVYLLTN